MDPRVLILEDDPDFARLLGAHVRVRWPGAQVQVRDPSKAPLLKEDFRKGRYDLVLLDYQLGGLNGLDILRHFRKQAGCPPIIMITGTGHERLVVQVIRAGAADYIPKAELTQAILVEAMEQALALRPAATGDAWGATGLIALGESGETNPDVDDIPIIRMDEFLAQTSSRREPEAPPPVLPDPLEVPGAGVAQPPDIPGYRLVKALGPAEPGRSQALLAVRLEDKTPVVIKRLSFDPGDPRQLPLVELARKQAGMLGKLASGHVGRVLECGVTGNWLFVATEYGAKGSLQLRLSAALPPAQALSHAAAIARSLQAVHAAGVAHGNLKPANLLVRADGALALIDFGASHALRSAVGTGTEHYWSPEQARGEPAHAADDLYALGAILYQMLTGSPPYRARTPQAVLHKHANAPIPELPAPLAGLQPLIGALLAKTRAERPGSAADVVAALAPSGG